MQKSFVLSIGLHGALFAALYVHFGITPDNIGTQQIMAYMYQRQLLHKHQGTSLGLLAKDRAKIKGAQIQAAASSAVDQSARQTPGEMDGLLMLLHDMIETRVKQRVFAQHEQKFYVAFTLFPDGHIENARLVEASETADLNRAVIAAVNAIQPVAFARNFLSVPRELTIQIIFGT